MTLTRIGPNIFYGSCWPIRSCNHILREANLSTKWFSGIRDGNTACRELSLTSEKAIKSHLVPIIQQIELVTSSIYPDRRLVAQSPYIVKYQVDSFHSSPLHTDNSAATSILFLNDGYSGGRLAFPHLGLRIIPRTGWVLVFPGGDEYPHESERILSGTKYSLVMMFNQLKPP